MNIQLLIKRTIFALACLLGTALSGMLPIDRNGYDALAYVLIDSAYDFEGKNSVEHQKTVRLLLEAGADITHYKVLELFSEQPNMQKILDEYRKEEKIKKQIWMQRHAHLFLTPDLHVNAAPISLIENKENLVASLDRLAIASPIIQTHINSQSLSASSSASSSVSQFRSKLPVRGDSPIPTVGLLRHQAKTFMPKNMQSASSVSSVSLLYDYTDSSQMHPVATSAFKHISPRPVFPAAGTHTNNVLESAHIRKQKPTFPQAQGPVRVMPSGYGTQGSLPGQNK